ncbi:GntR family transcriptional regulator [Rhizobium aegyptiacum]|uniref:GntR family transcriptional regulator n=1 Tax=Rhizobium aegyptiacum TaxID=1764550 RepID=UPI0007E565AD|nr:GntR family transcriptional regulator [Rhizobium aegyptiacum]
MIYQSNRPAYQALKRKIVEGDIPFGAPISVKSLEAEISSSAIPIREALIALAAEDVIDCYPGKGFFNKRLDVESVTLRLEFLENLMLASAATFPDTRRSVLRKRLNQDGLRSRATADQIFDNVTMVSEIFDTYFAHPTAIFTRAAIAQCARYLLLDEQLAGGDGRRLWKSVCTYFWLASGQSAHKLNAEINAFFEIRKRRVPEIIEELKEHEMLHASSMFSSAVLDATITTRL